MSSSDSTLGASSKRPVLYWWLTLLVVLMVSAIASPRTKSSGDTRENATPRVGISSNQLLREHGFGVREHSSGPSSVGWLSV